jgi:hypothetical protein
MKPGCIKKAIFQYFVVFINFLFNEPVSSRDKVEEDEVGGTCGTNGREEERV